MQSVCCRFSHVQLFAALQIVARLLCPWDSLGKNTEVSSRFLLGIFPTQGSKLSLLYLLHWHVVSLSLVPVGKPFNIYMEY